MSEGKINWNDYKNLNQKEIEEKAEEILSRLTLKEKVKMMSGDRSLLIGGLPMLIRYNKKPIPAGRIKRLNIPGILFADGPRGIVVRNSTCFPVSMARGASFDIGLEEKIGNIIGIEGRAQGANYFGGVCINLLRHPAWGRAQETFGEDPFLLGEMGCALMRGVQNHMMACAKHYACNSMENARFKVDVNIDERTLREVYLWHFRKCVESGVASIMNAYNKVNGKYCGHNPHLLTEILKKDWEFKGFLITDFMLGIRDGKKAVNAGVDIEMPFKWRMSPKKMLKLLDKQEISQDQIDKSCKRILRQLIQFVPKGDPSRYTKDTILGDEHIQLAREAARKSIVLLKNEDKLLPLKIKNVNKLAVIGKLADMENTGDHGSSRVYPPYVVTPLEGIESYVGSRVEVVYDEGEDLEQVKNVVKDADCVLIVAGYTRKDEGEYVFSKGGDRENLRLKESDEKLINTISEINLHCVVAMEGGSAIITENWRENVAAILMLWYPGMEGGSALAEILFGKVNPSGKLPVVFPKSDDQLPFFDKDAKSITYEYYHGYKLMDKEGYLPAFPFGFGLSYTTFSYKNLRVDQDDELIKAHVDITNTGKVFGEEIAQLYVGYINPSVDRPVKELKGFGRVALEPGETKNFTIPVKIEDLGYYDVEQKRWLVEKIEYQIFVGPSSRKEDLLEETIRIS